MEMDKAMEVAAPSLTEPIVPPPVIDESVNVEGGVPNEPEQLAVAKAEEEHAIPMPPPLLVAHESPMVQPVAQQMEHQPVNEAMAAPVVAVGQGGEEITITDQDVLFGRGGLTNRHIGNLRYRDIISIHRQDYVNAQKTEKPNVARRIVKAIRTGKNPGRFLRKGEDGKWHEVSDKEAAWKASQALREKSRWSSMKQAKAEAEAEAASPPAASAAVTTVEKVVEMASGKTVDKAKKRKSSGQHATPPPKKVAVGAVLAMAVQPQPQIEIQAPAEPVPTEISHIVVPPVITLGDRKVGANYMLPAATMNTSAADIFPRDEDILFGRGGRTNHHPGNKRLREIVNKYRDTYNSAKKVDKPKVSKLIVSALRTATPPSRFLRMNEENGHWEDVGDKRAAEKVSQTLREKDKQEKTEYLARKASEAKAKAEPRPPSQLESARETFKTLLEINPSIPPPVAGTVPMPSPLKNPPETIDV